MNNEELKDYTVIADAGITFNEVDYAKDATVSLTEADAAQFVVEGSIAIIGVDVGAPGPTGNADITNFGQGAGVTGPTGPEDGVGSTQGGIKKYRVLNDSGIYSNFDSSDHAKDEIVDLNPEDEQTVRFVEGGIVEEVAE